MSGLPQLAQVSSKQEDETFSQKTSAKRDPAEKARKLEALERNTEETPRLSVNAHDLARSDPLRELQVRLLEWLAPEAATLCAKRNRASLLAPAPRAQSEFFRGVNVTLHESTR
jgi:hypothetical protein